MLAHGTCHHACPASCGWVVTVTKGRAVDMSGDPDHPFSRGELCPKVNRFLDRVYSPDRVLHPLRRVGPKGEGRFERISWDEATSIIAERLHATIRESGAESILPFSDAGNQGMLAMSGISARFFHHLGASRLIRALCGPTVGAGVKMTNGSSLGFDPLDLEHSRLILLWGTNTRLTNRHLWPTIETARERGARVVVIDPLRTITADSADEFIQPRAGTDIAMMLAMMNVIIGEQRVDREWIDAHTLGFDELAEHVAAWTPERAAEATGVDAEVIVRLAREYATTRPAAIRTLVGPEHHENGAMFFRTLACLPALTGAWRDRGGGLSRSVGSWQEELIDDVALERPDLLAGRSPRAINMSRLGEALTTADPTVRDLIIWNANPMVTIPNRELVRTGLEREDLFCVVHDQFITDTARYADIVLPATTHIESVDVVPAWGHLWLGWNEAAIEPLGEAVSNTECFRRIASAMRLDEPSLFDDDVTLIRAALPTVDIDALRADHHLRVPYPNDGRPWADGGFPTATGRVEFASDQLAALGHPRLPDFIPPNEGPTGPLAKRFPLQLLTPKHHLRFLNSSYSHLPGHGDREGAPFVEMHQDDANQRGLTQDDQAEIHNDRGSMSLPVRISNRVRPGTVVIPWGWVADQHPDGRVANSLTNDTLTDWGGGVAFSDTLVDVRPV
ncbi:MAG: molybdopterin-containing oxidoreductase family protein [Ilumatobacteraceae bacterium]